MSFLKIISDIFNSIFPVKETPQSPEYIVNAFIQTCYDEATSCAKAIHHAFSFDSEKDNHGLALLMKNSLDTHFAELTTDAMNDRFLSQIQQNALALQQDIIKNAITSLLHDMPHFTLIDSDDSTCFTIALETAKDMYEIDTSNFLLRPDEDTLSAIDGASALSQIRHHLEENDLIAVGFALEHGFLFALVPNQNEAAINALKTQFDLDFSINRFLNKIYYESLHQGQTLSHDSNSQISASHNVSHSPNNDTLNDLNQTPIHITSESKSESLNIPLDSHFKKSALYASVLTSITSLPAHLALDDKENSLFKDALDNLKDDYLSAIEQELYFTMINQESKIPLLKPEDISIDSIKQHANYYAQTTFALGLIFERLPFTIQAELPYCSYIADNILERIQQQLTQDQLAFFESLANGEMDEYSEDLDEDLNQSNHLFQKTLDNLNLAIVAIENGSDDMCLIVVRKHNLEKTIQLLNHLLLEATVINEFF